MSLSCSTRRAHAALACAGPAARRLGRSLSTVRAPTTSPSPSPSPTTSALFLSSSRSSRSAKLDLFPTSASANLAISARYLSSSATTSKPTSTSTNSDSNPASTPASTPASSSTGARVRKPSPYRLPTLPAFLAAFAPLHAAGWRLDLLPGQKDVVGTTSHSAADDMASGADLQGRRLVRAYTFPRDREGWRALMKLMARIGEDVEATDVSCATPYPSPRQS